MPTLRRPSKGIKLIKSVYPENENNGVIHHQLEMLIKYLLMNPAKLEEIGKYIEKRLKKDLSKGRYGYVKISMDVLNNIIQSCHSNSLTFYAPYVVSILQELFSLRVNNSISLKNSKIQNQNFIEIYNLKVRATETFEKFAQARNNNNVSEYQDLSFFVDYFVHMASNDSPESDHRRKLRIYGLKGLHIFITNVDDLDNFVSKFINILDPEKNIVIPCIICNMIDYKDDISWENSLNEKINDSTNSHNSIIMMSPYHWAITCLNDLSGTISTTTIKSILIAIVNYLDLNKVWPEESIVKNLIKAISLKPQHNQIIINELLVHLDKIKDISTKTYIVSSIIFFFEEIARGSVAPMIEILIPLIRTLLTVKNHYEENYDEDSINMYTDENNNSNNKLEIKLLQKKIINSIGVVSKRNIDMSEKLESIAYITEKLNVHQKNKKICLLLLKCIRKISMNLSKLSFPKTLPNKIVDPLLSLMIHEDFKIRIIVQKIFHSFLQSSNKRLSMGLTNKSMDFLEDKRNEILKLMLYKSLLMENNQPKNFSTIFKNLIIFFKFNRGKELEQTFPLIFQLEEKCKEHILPPHLCNCIHSVIGSYLLYIARIYSNQQLEDYISQIMNKEWSSVLSFENDELKPLRKTFKEKIIKKSQHVKNIIDREKVVEYISKSQLLLQYKDIKQSLMMPMNVDKLDIINTPQILQQPPLPTTIPTIQEIPKESSEILPTLSFDDFKKILEDNGNYNENNEKNIILKDNWKEIITVCENKEKENKKNLDNLTKLLSENTLFLHPHKDKENNFLLTSNLVHITLF